MKFIQDELETSSELAFHANIFRYGRIDSRGRISTISEYGGAPTIQIKNFHRFPQFLQVISEVVLRVKIQPLPSSHFQMHYSLTNLLCDAI